MWRRIQKHYPPELDILTFSVMFGIFIYVFFMYGKLPDEIPIHFNTAGEADDWGNKATLFGLMLIHFHAVVLMFVLNYFLIIRSADTVDSLQLINIPFVNKEELTEEQIGMVKANIARMFAITNLILSFMFSVIYYDIIQHALGEPDKLGFGFEVLLVLLFIPIFYYVRKTYRDVKTR